MEYTPQTTLTGPSHGSPDVFAAIFADDLDAMQPDPRPYWETMYELCHKHGFRADLLLFQSGHETSEDRDGDGRYVPWTSDAWSVHNPAGIGVTNNSERKKYDFKDGRTAAGVHVARMWIYVHGPDSMPDDLKPYWAMSPRQKEAIAAAGGKCRVLADLNGRWAWPGTTYAQKIAALANRHADHFDDPYSPAPSQPSPPKEPPMAGHTITWPGLPGGPITFSFPVSTQYIVPAWRTLQRPGIKARKPRRSVQHSNGNPNALARQDTIYLFNGAGGRQASWHGTVDHKEGFANLPADELGWHASDGAGPGNYSGFAVEYSEYPRYNLTAAEHRQGRRNAAEMSGRVAARLEIKDPDYHIDYAPDKKGCPRVILENPVWLREYEADWWFFYNDEKARMAGGVPVDTGFKIGDRFEVIADALNIRVGYGTSSRMVATLLKGRQGAVVGDNEGRFTVQADGYSWLNVRIDDFGTGWVATGLAGEPWLQKVTTPAPQPEPPAKTYTRPLAVPELLQTQMTFEQKYHTAEGITTVNELEFIFVADVIEFKRQSKALAYGDVNAPEAKDPYSEGERVIAAWLVKGQDGVWYYLLTGGDDEWVRVLYGDTIRISDAPLIPAPHDTHITEALVGTLLDVIDDGLNA